MEKDTKESLVSLSIGFSTVFSEVTAHQGPTRLLWRVMPSTLTPHIANFIQKLPLKLFVSIDVTTMIVR